MPRVVTDEEKKAQRHRPTRLTAALARVDGRLLDMAKHAEVENGRWKKLAAQAQNRGDHEGATEAEDNARRYEEIGGRIRYASHGFHNESNLADLRDTWGKIPRAEQPAEKAESEFELAKAARLALPHAVGTTMRRFLLDRHEDVHDTSGEGEVVEGIEFSNGKVAMRWRSKVSSIALFDSVAEMMEVHGHDGKTTLRYLDEAGQPTGKALGLADFEKAAVQGYYRTVKGKRVYVRPHTRRGERRIGRVYRGINEQGGPADPGDLGIGTYYTTSRSMAKQYGRLTEADFAGLGIRHPKRLAAGEAVALVRQYGTVQGTWDERKGGATRLTRDLQAQGYDGIIAQGWETTPDHFTIVKFPPGNALGQPRPWDDFRIKRGIYDLPPGARADWSTFLATDYDIAVALGPTGHLLVGVSPEPSDPEYDHARLIAAVGDNDKFDRYIRGRVRLDMTREQWREFASSEFENRPAAPWHLDVESFYLGRSPRKQLGMEYEETGDVDEWAARSLRKLQQRLGSAGLPPMKTSWGTATGQLVIIDPAEWGKSWRYRQSLAKSQRKGHYRTQHGKRVWVRTHEVKGRPRAATKAPAGYIAVYRGTGRQGLGEVRPSPEGQMGPGVYFYDDPYEAAMYAEPGGGVITGYVRVEDVKQVSITSADTAHPHKVIVLADPTRFIRRGTIPTEDTGGGRAHVEEVAALALTDHPDTGKPGSSLGRKLIELRGEMARAAQKVYDEWSQDEAGLDPEVGGGGICDEIASEIGSIVGRLPEVEVTEGGQEGDDHAWIIAYRVGGRGEGDGEGYAIDISPRVYETGGGMAWRKLAGVTITPDDVSIERLPDDWLRDIVDSRYEGY